MTRPDKPRLAILVGHGGSLPPADIARSATDLVDFMFVVDSADATAEGESLQLIARALGPTIAVDFSDLDACVAALRGRAATAATTFTDRLCLLTARVNAEITSVSSPIPQWGHKDTQRQALREAGLSRVRSASIGDEQSLRSFVRSAGFPVVVKPTAGVASRDTWLLSQESDVVDFAHQWAETAGDDNMFAEQFIVGEDPPAPHLGDYVSVEVFRSGPARQHYGLDQRVGFVTDRLLPAWPCRETGFSAPSSWSAAQQESLLASAQRALSALHATAGAFHVEIKPARPHPEIIEVNGRLGGFVAPMVRYGTGADVARLALTCVLDAGEGLDMHWSRCVSVLFLQSPPQAAWVSAVPSRREISRRTGVLAVDELCQVGSAVDWRSGTNYGIARVWLAADDHSELRARLIDVATYLDSEFSYVDAAGQPVRDHAWLEGLARET